MKYLINKFLPLLFFIGLNNAYAIQCSDYGAFKEYNGHYYAINNEMLSFATAKAIAENNDGYIAIPNNAGENNFLKSLTGGNKSVWLGIRDKNMNTIYGSNSTSRFTTLNDNTLAYSNWDTTKNQPDNFLGGYDVINNVAQISPLGENWVVLNGNNGKWYDVGNHIDSNNNPYKAFLITEFETKPICFLTDDKNSVLPSNKVCNTKVWDSTVDTATTGKTFNCLKDKYNNDYCPSSLAKAGEYWDYKDGYSVQKTGTKYANKVVTTYDCSYTKPEYHIEYTASGTMSNGKCNGYLNVDYFYTPAAQWFMDQCTNKYGANSEGGSLYLDNGDGTCWGGNVCRTLATVSKTCSTTACPSGYTNNGSNCKKNYSYYLYLCHSETNEFSEDYSPINGGGVSSTNSTPPHNNCKRKEFTCNSHLRKPAFVNNKWQCSPFPCVGKDNYENLDTTFGTQDKKNDGWNEDGNCTGKIYIFNGKSDRCRAKDKLLGFTGGGCCDKDKVAFGLISCKADEKLLAKKNQAELTHYIGSFCSKQLKLWKIHICIQTSNSYCSFSSKLARVITEQGRSQLGISWGSPSNPNCRGFTPDEFQKLDLSKMDLSSAIDIPNANDFNIDDTRTNLMNNLKNMYGGNNQ